MNKTVIFVFSGITFFISFVVLIYTVFCLKNKYKLEIIKYKFKYEKLTPNNIEYFSDFNYDSDEESDDDNTIVTIST